MKVAVRKLQIEDAAKLQMLVAENIDAIEPGLVVLDSRLLLGHATIDVVGLDADGALVLIATGLTANEEMLLKAVEAYSWCREYPESLERLYPSCIISDARPPRLVFVVERMPDAFHRKIKQLGFPEVDCVEFRLLDVDGAPAMFFESILRLRRPAATPAPAPRTETPAESPAAGENVIAMNGAVAARATSLKLQKLLNQAAAESPISALRPSERPVAPVREPAAVVSIVNRQAAASAPRVERPRPEPVRLREAAPVIVPAPLTPVEPVTAAPVLAPAPVLAVEPVIAAAPVLAAAEPARAAAPAIVHEPEPLVVPAPIIVTPEPVIAMPEPVVVAPAPVIVTPEPIVLPKAVDEPEPVAAPDPDLTAQMQAVLAAFDQNDATTEPVLAEPEPVAEPKLELVIGAAPVLAVEPKLELVAEPEPIPAIEPKLELVVTPAPVLAVAPRLELVAEAKPAITPSAPLAVPRLGPIPAPVAKPAVAAEAPAVAAPQEPRVSFKDLAAALLGPTPVPAAPAVDLKAPAPAISAPVVSAPSAEAPAAPVLKPTPSALEELAAQAAAAAEAPAEVVVEPVSPEMAAAVADLEPALTVEALINSALAPAPVAPAAPAVAAPVAQKPAPEAAKPEALPLEFAGLQFPKDGVMTRQWMEFLSQMSSPK